MAEKNIIIEKALNKNYLNVQKKEIEVDDISVKLGKDFKKNTAKLERDLKAEQKEITKQKKDTKAKYKTNLDSIIKQYEEHLEILLKSREEVEEDYIEEIESTDTIKDSGNTKLNKAIVKLEKDYLKQVEDTQKEYEKNVAKSDKKNETDRINSKAESDKEDLVEKLNIAKEKHNEIITSLNEKYTEKQDKLVESSDKIISKINKDITKEESIITKKLEELKSDFDKNMGEIDTNHSRESDHFDAKYEAIETTLESKVNRHEKFMNKNIEDNDQRAAKQHKKEIAILQKNAEKELKLLTAEHSDRAKEFAPKKRVLIHKNLESVADISKKLIQFREEKLFEIESHKSNLNSDIEVLKLGTDLKIQEELNKYNEIERDNAIKLIGVSLKQELDLEQVLDTQSKLEIVFNKEKAYNKLKHDEALANKAKEFNVFGVNNEEGLKIAKLRKTIEITKLDNETELAEKELVLDIKVNEENEKIDYHNLDFIVQGQISNENLLYQTEFKSLFEAREDSLLAYEELEANNRALLKVKFLEAQKAKIEADKDAFIKKINTSSEAEKVLYEQEKEKVSSKDLEELKIYEEEANKNIENITIKRDTLDRKENKKEIKELDLEIKNLRDKLNSYVKTKNVSISLNTELFNKGIEEVNDRNALSIEQTEDFFGLEVSRIDKAINLVNQNKNEEINDAKEGHLKTFENTSLLLQNAQIRNNQSIEQNTAYKISMVQNKNDVIKDFKDDFEKQKHEINESFNKAISELESEIKSEESKISGDISKEESNLEHKVVAFDKKFQEIKNDELKELNKLASAHKENFSKIEQKENIEIKKIKDEFTQKESSCKSKISEINKKSGNHSKIFESNKKAAKRDYELALSKKISELNTKLQQDIKAL